MVRAARPERAVCADVPEDDEWPTHERLVNWGDWCRIRPSRAGRCNSAEGGFTPEAGRVWNPQEPRPYVDLLDAEVMNSTLIALAHEFRFGLRLRYFQRWPDKWIARSIPVPRLQYQSFMRRARLMVRNHLLSGKSAYHIQPNSARVWRESQNRSLEAGSPVSAETQEWYAPVYS
jgi:hypothetical protein